MRHFMAFFMIAFKWTQLSCTSNTTFDEIEEASERLRLHVPRSNQSSSLFRRQFFS